MSCIYKLYHAKATLMTSRLWRMNDKWNKLCPSLYPSSCDEKRHVATVECKKETSPKVQKKNAKMIKANKIRQTKEQKSGSSGPKQ